MSYVTYKVNLIQNYIPFKDVLIQLKFVPLFCFFNIINVFITMFVSGNLNLLKTFTSL